MSKISPGHLWCPDGDQTFGFLKADLSGWWASLRALRALPAPGWWSGIHRDNQGSSQHWHMTETCTQKGKYAIYHGNHQLHIVLYSVSVCLGPLWRRYRGCFTQHRMLRSASAAWMAKYVDCTNTVPVQLLSDAMWWCHSHDREAVQAYINHAVRLCTCQPSSSQPQLPQSSNTFITMGWFHDDSDEAQAHEEVLLHH